MHSLMLEGAGIKLGWDFGLERCKALNFCEVLFCVFKQELFFYQLASQNNSG